MLNTIPPLLGGPTTIFDRWIKQYDTIVDLSTWTDKEKINMLVVKTSDKANDIIQNIVECNSNTCDALKNILNERFHGDETIYN